MDWLDIGHYIVICLILGIDYQVYMCVAIFKHLQRAIMSRLQTQDLIMLLKVGSSILLLKGFVFEGRTCFGGFQTL